MKLTMRREGDTRGWPTYIFAGRMRTSTAGLMLAFFALFWLNQNYQPAPATPVMDPAQQVVPPGYVPDPDYTWVPRTNVRPRETEYPTTTTPRTTTTTTTTPTTAPTTPPDSPTTTTGPADPLLPFGPTTTVIDPDGPGPLGPETFTQEPPSVPSTTPAPTASTPTTIQPRP